MKNYKFLGYLSMLSAVAGAIMVNITLYGVIFMLIALALIPVYKNIIDVDELPDRYEEENGNRYAIYKRHFLGSWECKVLIK